MLLSTTSKSSSIGGRVLQDVDAAGVTSTQLAVTMEVMGHYSPPPEIDFDYIVQDSINRDTDNIRRGLSEYNTNCRQQTSLVEQEGLAEYDFDSVSSTSGARPTGYDRPLGGGGGGNTFSTACSSSLVVPEFFETNLREIEAVDASEVKFDSLYIVNDVSSGLESWARGPVAAMTCFIVMLLCVLLFRRALGRRRTSAVDTHDEKDKKRHVAGGGRMGGIKLLFDKRAGRDVADDGSVDSAFYSDQDEDDDDVDGLDGKAKKEGKVRRKKKDANGNEKSSSTPLSTFHPAPPSSKVASDPHKSFRGIPRTSFDRSFKGKRRAGNDAAGLDSKPVCRSSVEGGIEDNQSNDTRRTKSTKKPSTSIVTDGRSDPSDEASRAANEKRRLKSDGAMRKKERS